MNPTNPHPEIRASVLFITPKTARNLLDKNLENQRRVKKDNLTKVEGAIRADLFRLNGESIIISKTGRLLNGQHRIIAVVNTGIGIWSVVVENVPDEYFDTMDSGSSRRFQDVLKIGGSSHAHAMATTIQRLAEYRRDPGTVGSMYPFSSVHLNKVRAESQGIEDSINACQKRRSIISTTRCAWLHYLGMQRCPKFCSDFFDKFFTGLNLEDGSAIAAFRYRLIQSSSGARKLDMIEVLALLVKAWNFHAEKKSVSFLTWPSKAPFPVVRFPNEGLSGAADFSRNPTGDSDGAISHELIA